MLARTLLLLKNGDMKRNGTMALILCIALASCMPNYSNGRREGVVTKFSHKGVFFKSWEGELVQGGVRQKRSAHFDSKGNYAGSTTSSVANVFAFSVQSKACIEAIQKSMENGDSVILTYRQWLKSPPNIDSDYVVTDVKVIE